MTAHPLLPELIVVRWHIDREFVERQIAGKAHIRCISVDQGLPALIGTVVARITVAADVKLDRDFHGEGSLREILLSRIRTYGPDALLVQLP